MKIMVVWHSQASSRVPRTNNGEFVEIAQVRGSIFVIDKHATCKRKADEQPYKHTHIHN